MGMGRMLNDQIPIFVYPLFSIITTGGEGGKMPALLYAQEMGTSHSQRGSVRAGFSAKKNGLYRVGVC